MKQRKIKKIITKAVILSIISAGISQGMLFWAPTCAYALSTESNNKIIQSSKNVLEWEKRKHYSSIWQFLTKVRQDGLTEDEKTKAIGQVKEDIKEIDDMSGGELAKDIMVLSACGVDSTNFESKNLLPILLDKIDLTNAWSIYSVPYAIMACNSYNFTGDIDSSSHNKLQDMVDYLINTQQSDGQWTGGGADAVGPALYALSIYKDDSKVKSTIDKAVEYLKINQKADGLFIDSWGKAENSNSTSMAIFGLAACNIDLEKDFVKDKSTIDMLLSFQIKDSYNNDNGAFLWKADQDGGLELATEQAAYSLAQAVGGADYKIFDFKSNWTIESVSVNKLDVKEGVTVSDGTAAWKPVENAVKYEVYINGTKAGETKELSFAVKNYNKTDKIEIAAVDSDGNLIGKADSSFVDKNQTPADDKKTDNKNSSIGSYSCSITDSHNKTYTNSPIVTDSPNYTGSVSDNSTVINMGSIYSSTGKAKVKNDIEIDGKKCSQELGKDDSADGA